MDQRNWCHLNLSFLLQHIRTLSAGRTLAVNQALVTTNADLAGKIVVALARLSAKQNTVPKGS